MAAPRGFFVDRARNRRWNRSIVVALVAALTLVFAQIALAVVQGNIAPSSIEIDSPANAQGTVPAPGADLFPGTKTCGQSFPSSGALDWVKDCEANAGGTNPPGVVTGLVAGTTGASPVCQSTPATFPATCATGHWNGVRIVDGVGGNDQDIFTKGGKEQDLSTWNIAPGTVGSSKYDASQMYLANNQTHVFFGMERIGNNGSTAFDFEFNQLAPVSTYVPNRSNGDVLLTFEMSGSGSSGSATAHYFTYGSGQYSEVTPLPSGIQTSINNSANTPGEPWGHVNDKGQWVLGNLDRFTFAEAAVPLSLLGFGNGSGCNGNRYVQIRTRSSSTDTSDLKDTTPSFAYSFGGPTAAATLATACATKTFANPNGNPTFTYNGAGSHDSGGGTSVTYAWSIDVSPVTATLSGGNVTATATPGHYTSTASSGTVTVDLATAGVPAATITVRNTVNEGGCDAATGNKTVTVYAALGATATLTPHCDKTFDFSGTASGGKAPYAYAWTFQKNSGDNGSGSWSTASGTFSAGSATSASGTFVASVQGRYRALLTVTDTADTSNTDPQTGLPINPDVTTKGQCSADATSNQINVYDAIGGSVSLTPTCGHTFTFSASGSAGKAPYTYAFTLQKLVSGSWVTSSTWNAADSGTPNSPSGTIDIDNPPSPPAGTNPGGALTPGGPGRYRLLVTISDSQTPACTISLTSNEIDARDQLTVSISKTGSSASDESVTMGSLVTNNFTDTITYSWAKSTDNSTFTTIANSNSPTLTYSGFETDDTSPDSQSFTIGSDQYNGKVYVVWFRLTVSRTLNNGTCSATSTSLVTKKVIGVDP